jgi:CRISPR-associated endonuclease/helicase Cas3
VLQAIVQAVRAGQRVAWVCNTGDAAQQARSALAAWAPDSTAALRAGQLRILTPGDEPALGSGVDLLVSDLAPVDRLLQRAGHLCRAVRAHHGAWLDGWGEPSMWVLGPAWAGQSPAVWIEAALPETAMRYPHHGQLWRTALALQAERWQLPHEVRALIETVFNGDEDLPDGVHLHARQREGSR